MTGGRHGLGQGDTHVPHTQLAAGQAVSETKNTCVGFVSLYFFLIAGPLWSNLFCYPTFFNCSVDCMTFSVH